MVSSAMGANNIAVNGGANMNFDRLRYVAERADIGAQREALFAVDMPETPGSFLRFCELLGKSSVTEFKPGASAPFFQITNLKGQPLSVAVDAKQSVYVNESFGDEGFVQKFARGSNTAERTIDTGNFRTEADDDDLVLREASGRTAALTHWSFGQLATIASAPPNYLRTLPAEIASSAIN